MMRKIPVSIALREEKKEEEKLIRDIKKEELKHSYLNCKGCNRYFLFFLALLKVTKVKASSHNGKTFSTR